MDRSGSSSHSLHGAFAGPFGCGQRSSNRAVLVCSKQVLHSQSLHEAIRAFSLPIIQASFYPPCASKFDGGGLRLMVTPSF
mmetsp:Transcript_8781/g.23620  ORF Transcript_8781/g.23620 Transcript_8781/m.23620 type:complete len:81 (+) Transcript_8781:4715-4957(+)